MQSRMLNIQLCSAGKPWRTCYGACRRWRQQSEAIADACADHQRVKPGAGLYGRAQRVDAGVRVHEDLLDVKVGKPVASKVIVETSLDSGTDAVAHAPVRHRGIGRLRRIEEAEVDADTQIRAKA